MKAIQYLSITIIWELRLMTAWSWIYTRTNSKRWPKTSREYFALTQKQNFTDNYEVPCIKHFGLPQIAYKSFFLDDFGKGIKSQVETFFYQSFFMLLNVKGNPSKVKLNEVMLGITSVTFFETEAWIKRNCSRVKQAMILN